MNSQNQISFSDPASVGTSAKWLQIKLEQRCSQLANKIKVYKTSGFGYDVNGFGYYIHYKGKNEDVGQATIINDPDTPLAGDNITMYSNTTTPYSNNLFYEPIPFEWLKTHETQPQLIVSVNGEPAVCHNLTCGYAYVEP
jgi:hypothetical protein